MLLKHISLQASFYITGEYEVTMEIMTCRRMRQMVMILSDTVI